MRRLALAHLLSLALAIPAFASDGVLEINQTCATQTGCFTGDTAGFPVTINESGSYRLTSNLLVGNAGSGISITSDDVAIDLMGFTLRGSSPQGSGVATGISGESARISVSNGSVVGFSFGVSLLGEHASIHQLKIRTVLLKSIETGPNCTIRDSSTYGGSSGSILTGSSCEVTGNRISHSSNGPALTVGSGSVARSNTIYDSPSSGIAAFNSLVTGNVILSASYGTAIGAQGGTVSDNVIGFALGNGIDASDAVVSGNRIRSATIGIRCLDCSVVDNVVSNCSEVGLDATGGTGTTGYRGNQFNGNNGGNANPQVLGGIETGPNVCGGDLTCP